MEAMSLRLGYEKSIRSGGRTLHCGRVMRVYLFIRLYRVFGPLDFGIV